VKGRSIQPTLTEAGPARLATRKTAPTLPLYPVAISRPNPETPGRHALSGLR
jgi:hypothetical protein